MRKRLTIRKRHIVGFVILNAILAVALMTGPAASQILPAWIFEDCCKGTFPNAYCCDNCCFFVNDCEDDEDCEDN